MDLTPFVGSIDEEAKKSDLRTNPFQDEGDDGRRPSSGPINSVEHESFNETKSVMRV